MSAGKRILRGSRATRGRQTFSVGYGEAKINSSLQIKLRGFPDTPARKMSYTTGVEGTLRPVNKPPHHHTMPEIPPHHDGGAGAGPINTEIIRSPAGPARVRTAFQQKHTLSCPTTDTSEENIANFLSKTPPSPPPPHTSPPRVLRKSARVGTKSHPSLR